VKAIVATGQLLLQAKAALPHGQWIEALEGAGISPRVAQMFISVAEHPAISNTSNYSHLLPAASNTLYVLSRVEPEERDIATLETGEVNPTTTLSETRAMTKSHGIKDIQTSTLMTFRSYKSTGETLILTTDFGPRLTQFGISAVGSQ
jgi:hypothetical protein